MRRFRFKFASVLSLRKSREEAALSTLGGAQRGYQAELARKAGLVADLNAALLRREQLGTEPTDIMSFRMEQDFIVGSKLRITQAEGACQRAGKGVEKALRNYLGARRQTKMIETLYDREHAEWRKSEGRRDQSLSDDLTSMRARFSPTRVEAELESEADLAAEQSRLDADVNAEEIA